MKKRNLAFVIIMSIITFGIYSLYWLIVTRKEMVAKGHSIPSVWQAILLPLLGFVVGAILLGVAGTNSSSATTTNGLSIVFGILLVGSLIAGVVLWVRLISSYCRAVEGVTNGQLTYGFNLAMAILHIAFSWTGLWLALVQYHFNRLGAPLVAVPQAPVAAQPPSSQPNPTVSSPPPPPQTPPAPPAQGPQPPAI